MREPPGNLREKSQNEKMHPKLKAIREKKGAKTHPNGFGSKTV
jgi:hypothetical protein